MTAFELFKRAYYHHMGQHMRHHIDSHTDPKSYVQQAFNDDLNEYYVEFAGSNGLWLTCDIANPTSINSIERLHDIDIFQGYWLCHYDGHTGDFRCSHYLFKTEALARFKEMRKFSFKHVDFFFILKVGFKEL